MAADVKREMLAIQMQPDLKKSLEVLCAQYQVDFSDLINDAMFEYLANHGFSVDSLVDGYTAAAQVNEELVHEFSACDNDLTTQL